MSKIELNKVNSALRFCNFEIVESASLGAAKNIIYSPEEYGVESIKRLKDECQNAGKELYLDTPNFALKQDVEILNKIIRETGVKIVANNYYALAFDTEKVIGYGLNVYNSYTASELKSPYISAENTQDMTAPYMTFRHCPIKTHVGGDCKNCKYHQSYYYKMDSGKKFKLKRKRLSSCTFYLI